MKHLLALAAVLTLASHSFAQISITEVHPSGSAGTTHYEADWWELTNFGAAPVDITGWRMDDNSGSFTLSVELLGVSVINPGQSVIFAETDDLAGTGQLFRDAWFGSNVPAGFAFGNYSGSGVGLSTGGDQVNIYDSTGVLVASVSFGAATTAVTFDNAEGLSGTIGALSQVGVNGAFTSLIGNEIGSPGTIGVAVPEPSSVVLMGGAALVAGGYCLRRKRLARKQA